MTAESDRRLPDVCEGTVRQLAQVKQAGLLRTGQNLLRDLDHLLGLGREKETSRGTWGQLEQIGGQTSGGLTSWKSMERTVSKTKSTRCCREVMS